MRPPARGRPPVNAARLRRRVLLAVIVVVVAVASQWGAFRSLSDRVFGRRIDWMNDYAMTTTLYDMIARRHLTSVSKACLLLIVDGATPPEATKIDVVERTTASCMGASAAGAKRLPHLLTLRVDRLDGRVQSDAGSPGVFHPLT